MKKKLLKVFSLLLLISILVITVSANVADKPQSDFTLTTEKTEVTLYGQAVEVEFVLDLATNCYGIEGKWSATEGIKLTALSGDNDVTLPSSGVVAWADVEGEDETKWFQKPMGKMTATYSIPANTAPGTYTVSFTCTMFAGGDFDKGDIKMWEGTFVYSAQITVKQHVCSDVITDTDHICDDENCPNEEAVTEHKHNTYGSDEKQHWSICDCGQIVGEKVDHDFTDGDCVCGAEKPAPAGLKGDVDGNNVVDQEDVLALLRHVLKANIITDDATLERCEVTGDDTLDQDDVIKILRYVLKAIDSLD